MPSARKKRSWPSRAATTRPARSSLTAAASSRRPSHGTDCASTRLGLSATRSTSTMAVDVKQQVVGDTGHEHHHGAVTHTHDHYHVSHQHVSGTADQFEHRAHYHTHEHNHPEIA